MPAVRMVLTRVRTRAARHRRVSVSITIVMGTTDPCTCLNHLHRTHAGWRVRIDRCRFSGLIITCLSRTWSTCLQYLRARTGWRSRVVVAGVYGDHHLPACLNTARAPAGLAIRRRCRDAVTSRPRIAPSGLCQPVVYARPADHVLRNWVWVFHAWTKTHTHTLRGASMPSYQDTGLSATHTHTRHTPHMSDAELVA
jgi:hypothetical protein